MQRNYKTQSCKLLGHPHATNVALSTICPIHSKQFCLETEAHSRKNRKRKLWDFYPVENSIRPHVVRR